MGSFFSTLHQSSEDSLQASVESFQKLYMLLKQRLRHNQGDSIAEAVANRAVDTMGGSCSREAMNQYHNINIDETTGLDPNHPEAERLVQSINDNLQRFEQAHETALSEVRERCPEDFFCPITLCLMDNPIAVQTQVNGETVTDYFEQEAIQAWLRTHNNNPLNRQTVLNRAAILNGQQQPDAALQNRITAFFPSSAQHTQTPQQ